MQRKRYQRWLLSWHFAKEITVLFADRYLYVNRKARMEGRQSLLWPAYAWKVLFPTDELRLGANLFQEAILGLLRAGERDTAQLARLLALDPELVRYIIATQLQPSGWLDAGMRLTPDGEKLLDVADDSRLNLTLGYAFQDAVTGAWLPRFAPSLTEIRPRDFDDSGRPSFLLDRERGWVDRPFILPNVIGKPSLDVEAMNEAYRAYRKDVAVARRRQDSASDMMDFQALESVDPQPTPVYLWCELYRDETEPQPWLVSDPFRLRKAAAWLRKPLLELAPGNRGLLTKMQHLIGAPDGELTAAEWLRQIEEGAELVVWSDFPFVAQHPLVREHLLRLLRQQKKIASQSRVNGEDLGLLAGEAYNLIEAVLKWMLQRWACDTGSWPKTASDPAQTKLEFQSLGLEVVTPTLVKQLAGQPRRSIAGAIDRQSGSFKALLAGSVFCAAVHEDHPFRKLPATSLRLDQLPPLADFRNSAGGHASGTKVSADEVLKNSRFAIEWMALFQPWF
jgi:hypothetical protein